MGGFQPNVACTLRIGWCGPIRGRLSGSWLVTTVAEPGFSGVGTSWRPTAVSSDLA